MNSIAKRTEISSIHQEPTASSVEIAGGDRGVDVHFALGLTHLRISESALLPKQWRRLKIVLRSEFEKYSIIIWAVLVMQFVTQPILY